jgi:hypothetical protein
MFAPLFNMLLAVFSFSVLCSSFLYARLETGRITWLGMAGWRPHRFPHNNFSFVYRIFTKLGHMIPLWKGKNLIYFGVIRSKVKVSITINRIFDNRVIPHDNFSSICWIFNKLDHMIPPWKGKYPIYFGVKGQGHHYYKYNFWQQGRFRTITSSVYWIFNKLGHMIPLWKGKNSIYFGVIGSRSPFL